LSRFISSSIAMISVEPITQVLAPVLVLVEYGLKLFTSITFSRVRCLYRANRLVGVNVNINQDGGVLAHSVQ